MFLLTLLPQIFTLLCFCLKDFIKIVRLLFAAVSIKGKCLVYSLTCQILASVTKQSMKYTHFITHTRCHCFVVLKLLMAPICMHLIYSVKDVNLVRLPAEYVSKLHNCINSSC